VSYNRRLVGQRPVQCLARRCRRPFGYAYLSKRGQRSTMFSLWLMSAIIFATARSTPSRRSLWILKNSLPISPATTASPKNTRPELPASSKTNRWIACFLTNLPPVSMAPAGSAILVHGRGVDIFGLDLSPGMLDQARKLNPNLEFQQGNMLALDVQDSAWSAIVAFYSIVHIPKADLPQALREMYRVLKPGGLLFLAFHLGDEVLHEENCWGRRISLDLVLFGRKEVERYLADAGFAIEDSLERDPYPPEVEYQSRRAYILARKPAPK